jgi:hypothetical protein
LHYISTTRRRNSKWLMTIGASNDGGTIQTAILGEYLGNYPGLMMKLVRNKGNNRMRMGTPSMEYNDWKVYFQTWTPVAEEAAKRLPSEEKQWE